MQVKELAALDQANCQTLKLCLSLRSSRFGFNIVSHVLRHYKLCLENEQGISQMDSTYSSHSSPSFCLFVFSVSLHFLSPQEQKDQSYSTVKTAATRISVNNLKPGTTYVFLIRPFSTPTPSSSLSSSSLSSSASSSSSSSSTSSSSSSSSSSSPPPIDYGAYSTPLELQTLGECE